MIVDVAFDGLTRPVAAHLPSGGRGRVLLDLHGSHGNGALHAAESRLVEHGTPAGFVVVQPNGGLAAPEPEADGLWLWHVPGVPTTLGEMPPPRARDDIGYLVAIIDALVGAGIASDLRACVVGMSGGARMASAFASARPDRVAALAAVAGLRPPRPPRPRDDPAGFCPPSVPVIAFHGQADDTNPYAGGSDPRWAESVDHAVTAWASYDSCDPVPTTTGVDAGADLVRYRGGTTGADVRLYRIRGGDHTWPGGPDDPGGIDASALICAFFAERP